MREQQIKENRFNELLENELDNDKDNIAVKKTNERNHNVRNRKRERENRAMNVMVVLSQMVVRGTNDQKKGRR